MPPNYLMNYMKTFELFPTPVGVYNLGREFTNEEKSFINLLLESPTSNVGNKTSRDTFVFKKDELGSLQQFCLESVSQFASEILWRKDVGLRITQSW